MEGKNLPSGVDSKKHDINIRYPHTACVVSSNNLERSAVQFQNGNVDTMFFSQNILL